MVSATIHGLEEIFQGLIFTEPTRILVPNILYQTSYHIDFKDARLREATIDDDLLCKSIMIHEGTEDIKYTATYLEAVTDRGTFQICLMEATNSLLKWMDLKDSEMSTIRSVIPHFVKDELMEVFFSCGPADSDLYYPMRLRNTLIIDYPENKYHVHLKGEAGS